MLIDEVYRATWKTGSGKFGAVPIGAMAAELVLAQGVGSQVAGRVENLTGVPQLTIEATTQGQTVELQYDLNKRVSLTVLRDQNGGDRIDLRLHKVF